MAAGRQNFSRKSYSNRSYEETYSYKNRFDQRNVANGLDRQSTKSSSGRISEHRRNGVDHGRFVPPSDHKLQDKNDHVENRSHTGHTKKRKFSPIVWDGAEKQVKLSSENHVLRTCSTSSEITHFLSPKSSKDIERCSVSAESELLQIASVESPTSLATTTPKQHEQEKNEGGEHVAHLSKSKWAFKDSPKLESANNSSLESGEFKLESFETNDEVSSLSTEDSHFQAPSIDVTENVDDYSSPQSDNDHQPSALPTMVPSCRNACVFQRLGKISEGTYGVVHKARDTNTGEFVALKKVKLGKEENGFPVTALREINILGMLQHPSLVEMKEVVMDDFNGVYMVMEYVDHELKGYMERMKQPFSQSEVKRLMLDLLTGVCYLHDNYVMHRDLKTSNLLVNNDGELKICDFGMARQYASPLKPYTSLVVTLWYRAPELLLGMKNYSTAVDMWSVGCIMAELLSKKPLFDGNREIEQIDKIFKTLGTPNDSVWPGYSKLPGVKSSFVKQPYNTLRKRFPVATFTGSPVLTELGFDLLNKFLTYDPEKRISAQEALNHGWFCESPLPAERVRICKQV